MGLNSGDEDELLILAQDYTDSIQDDGNPNDIEQRDAGNEKEVAAEATASGTNQQRYLWLQKDNEPPACEFQCKFSDYPPVIYTWTIC